MTDLSDVALADESRNARACRPLAVVGATGAVGSVMLHLL